MFIVGAFLGAVAKYSDTIPTNNSILLFFNYLGDITTRLSIWILIAALFIILPNGKQQYYKAALVAVLAAFLIVNLRIIPIS
jgi:uncharacterized BrkB/YihY/UPF0761 family membrane protein